MIFGDAEGARQFEQDAAAGGVVGSGHWKILCLAYRDECRNDRSVR